MTNMVKTQCEGTRKMREARQRLRVTQLALARRVGLSESQVSKIETGRCSPPSWVKEAVAKELGIQTWEVGL
jgi:DNA-binding XRE family transcriptional regulator